MQGVHLLTGAAIALAAGALTASDGALAADAYVVHGINGTNLDPSLDEVLPVDVAVLSPGAGHPSCLTAPGGPIGAPLEFTDVAGPIDGLPAGLYQFVISLADEANPCGGDPQVTGTANISSFDTALLIAHIDANGAPLLGKFTVNASAVAAGSARISAIHTAEAPGVDIEVSNDDTEETEAIFFDLENGDQTFPLSVAAPGAYRIRVSPSDPASTDTQPPVASRTITVEDGQIGVGVIVGSAVSDPLTLETIRVLIDTVTN